MSSYRDEQLAELRTELERYEAELLPGAVDAMMTLPAWQKLGRFGEPGMRARAVHEAINGPLGEYYHRPDFKPSDKPRDPLREVLSRYSDLLRPGAVDTLYAGWAIDLARRPEPEIVEAVARRLADPSVNEHLWEPLPPRPEVARMLAALRPFRHQLRPDAAEELAERWGDLAEDRDPRRLENSVAARLSLSCFSGYWRGGIFDPSDKRKAEPDDDASRDERRDEPARGSFRPKVRL